MVINQGVNLHILSTKKFKDIGISIRFMNTLDKEKAPARSLLALLLCDRCAKYDTKQKMSSHLDTLYGASLSAQTMGYGKSQVMEVRMKTMNPKYASDGDALMSDIFSFLHEILFQPLIKQEVFEEAKSMLLAKIERNEDDPAQYAISQGLKQAGKGTPLSLSALGEKENVMALTLQNIEDAYHEMIEQDSIHMIVCGDVEEQGIREMVQKYLPCKDRNAFVETYYTVSNSIHDEYKEAYKNISQTSIMMVWFSNTSVMDEHYYALRVANAIFGQYSTSFLFQEVREKNSLCYSIFSNLISYDGALGVTTGVEKKYIKKTIALIRKQFDRVVNGEFDDALLDVSKQMIINSLKASKDNMNSLIALQFQNDVLSRHDTTEDIIQKVQEVTREQVITMMKKCELKMTFVLTQGGDDHETN
ncbi:EF-P 5-aminopentanol modification-associated protein YfmF [Amedibacillus sp. YH-ame6]